MQYRAQQECCAFAYSLLSVHTVQPLQPANCTAGMERTKFGT